MEIFIYMGIPERFGNSILASMIDLHFLSIGFWQVTLLLSELKAFLKKLC